MAAPNLTTIDSLKIRPALRQDEDTALLLLLNNAFPNTFGDRHFFKQQPHRRLLAFHCDTLIGQIGLDFRAVTVGGEIFEIAGIIDLCVLPNWRGQGVGTELLKEAECLAIGRDFTVLFADDPTLYQRNGYTRISPALTRWFAIDDLQSHSVMQRDLSDCLMAKPLGSKAWPSGKIDLLGYLF